MTVTMEAMYHSQAPGASLSSHLSLPKVRAGRACPVYHLTRDGRQFLSGYYSDPLLLQKPVEPSQPQHLYHYVAVSESHRLFDCALAHHAPNIEIPQWVNEDEFINPGAEPASERRLLRSEFPGDSRVVCLPDAAFVLQFGSERLAVYLEQDRDTFFHDRVAARKSPGYRKLLAERAHRHHFPDVTQDFFYVLVIAPSQRRCQNLRNAFAKRNRDDSVQRAYRFASMDELNERNLFFDPVFWRCDEEQPVPLVRRTD